MEWDANLYETSHSFVWKHGESLIDLLAPLPGERILDVGCGTGHLTAKIAERGAEVTGLDYAGPMIEQARTAFPNLTFLQGDLLSFETAQPYDAIFSNAALHWIQPPEVAARNLFHALKPGGRMVVEFGGQGNIGSLLQAATEILEQRKPLVLQFWYFPSIGEYAHLLEHVGFEVVFCVLFDRPTQLEGGPSGLRNWLEMFGNPLLALSDAAFAEKLERSLQDRLFREGNWQMDYRRLRVAARRPA